MSTIAPPDVLEGEQHFVLRGISWAQYVTISDALPEWRGLRMIYVDRRLTFLATSRRHDWLSERLGHFVLTVASGFRVSWEHAGQTTLRREDVAVGVEGDKTFYFAENADLLRGPQEIDLSIHPPPDLAIEVEVSHAADDAMRTYQRLGVPEVWRLDAVHCAMTFWVRGEDGAYHPAARSTAFPELEPADILSQLRLAEQLGSSQWLAQLGDWVREVLLQRRQP